MVGSIQSISPGRWLVACPLVCWLGVWAGCERSAPMPITAATSDKAAATSQASGNEVAPPTEQPATEKPLAPTAAARSAQNPAAIKPAPTKPAQPKLPLSKPAAKASVTTKDKPSDKPAAKSSDADSGVERFVLLSPGGPLIVQLEMTIDGQPYKSPRRALVAELIRIADRDRDGRATWEEIYTQPRGPAARLLGLGGEAIDRKQFLRLYDTNQNGLIDADEAQRLVSRGSGAGASFAIEGSTEHRRRQRESAVWKLLDADGDGLLTQEEWSVAPDRLRACDANDDEALTWSELDDTGGAPADSMRAVRAARLSPPAACRLGPQADWDGIVFAFAELYLDEGEIQPEAFALNPTLPSRLDADGDGHLDSAELRRLEEMPADVELVARFGDAKDLPAGIELWRLTLPGVAAPAPRVDATAAIALALGDFSLCVEWRDRDPGTSPAPPAAEAQMAALDKDKNGYLEKKELEGNPVATLSDFDAWDADGDGKVFAAELTSFFYRQQAPQRSALKVTVRDDPDALWPLVDSDHDGRLSRAELAQAPERLGTLDLDADGVLAEAEIPGSITLVLERGGQRQGMPPQPAAQVAAAPQGPRWFQYMDVNRDQAVSQREFPAGLEQFKSLDANGDGAIDAAEATAADRPVEAR